MKHNACQWSRYAPEIHAITGATLLPSGFGGNNLESDRTMVDLTRITPGITGTADLVVTPEKTALFVGSGRIAVLATPVMINVIEAAALAAAEHLLPAGHQSLGIHLDVRHFAATPVGLRVIATAEVIRVEGRTIGFNVRCATSASRSAAACTSASSSTSPASTNGSSASCAANNQSRAFNTPPAPRDWECRARRLRRQHHVVEGLREHRRGEERDSAQRLLAGVREIVPQRRRQHEHAARPDLVDRAVFHCSRRCRP